MAIYVDPLTVTAVRSTSGAGTVSNTSSFQRVLRQTSVAAPTSLESIFAKASKKYGVPENMLKAVAKAESGFDANCVSSAGASGIMQLMPETAKGLGVTNVFDPEQNIMGGAKELAYDLKRYHGSVKLALAGYNAGCGNVDKYGGVPPFAETQNYVQKVMGYMGQNIDVSGKTVSTGSTGVDTSGLTKLSGTAADTSANSTAVNRQFTYQDYQMFVEILLNVLENGWSSDRTDSQQNNAWLQQSTASSLL